MGHLDTFKGMGLVSEVFNTDELVHKIGNAAIGHAATPRQAALI